MCWWKVSMSVELDKRNTNIDLPLPPLRVPSPPAAHMKAGKDLMRSPASLIGKEKESVTRKSALDMCKDFVTSHCRSMLDSKGKELSWCFHNNDIDPCLQDGPMCGLIALKYGADILQTSHFQGKHATAKNEIAELLQLSKDCRFSYNGEMFSARDMAALAQKYYQVSYNIVHSGLEDFVRLVKQVFQGYPVLVPYDADRNNEPCLKRGHKAHWAAITGFLFGTEEELKPPVTASADVPVYQLDFKQSYFLPTFKNKNLFVIARHGKSRHYGLWSWSCLYNSNNNLFELDPVELKNCEKTGVRRCLLTEGVQEGLCSKVLFFHPS